MAAHPFASTRPIGFSPREISTLVNRAVVDQHASESAFLWGQRDQATHAPHFKLKHLARFDARVVAHLRGLQVGGPAGWDAARAALAALDPGSLFTASYLAFGNQDPRQMSQVLQLGLTDPALERGLLSALAWLQPSLIRHALRRLDASHEAAHRRIGLAALVTHRLDSGEQIERATHDADPLLRGLGFRAIGETKRTDLATTVQKGLRDPDATCRFWAAWALALLGDTVAPKVAFDSSASLPAVRRTALDVSLRCGDPGWGRDVVRSLAVSPGARREAIRGAGILGDPVAVTWLLEQLDDRVNARVAGEALSMITGVDLEFEDLNSDPPEGDEETDPEDAELPWPDSAAVREWWTQHRAKFATGQRYLAGQPVSAAGAMSVLRDGYQRQRAAAAIELAVHTDSGVFQVGARADWQQKALST